MLMKDVAVAPLYWCPICGGKAKVISYPDVTWTGPMSYHSVKCTACGLSTVDYQSPHAAVAAWNRRAKEEKA